MSDPDLDRIQMPEPDPAPVPDSEPFVFRYGLLRITIERGPAGEIRSITDSQGNTWTRQN